MISRYMEYPCVRVNDRTHITKSGFKCECGLEYEYADHPIEWHILQEVTCETCRNIAGNYKNPISDALSKEPEKQEAKGDDHDDK